MVLIQNNKYSKKNLMKKLSLLLVLLVFGCKDKEETEFIKAQKQRKEMSENNYTDLILEMDTEKIALLSIIKKIPNDTLHLVLRDYLDKTFDFVTPETKIERIIDSISKKYHISKVKIASIIFSYNYEMLTKDEIEKDAIEKEKQE